MVQDLLRARTRPGRQVVQTALDEDLLRSRRHLGRHECQLEQMTC